MAVSQLTSGPGPTAAHPAPAGFDGLPTAWRYWVVGVDGAGAPILRGLLGFPWFGPVLEAKCVATDAPSGDGWGTPGRSDRHHRVVPAPSCACGIYGTTTPDVPARLIPLPPGSPIAAGFIELSGRTITAAGVIRAERGQIIGPVVVTPGAPPLPARLLRHSGVPVSARRVVPTPHGFRVGWGRGSRREWDAWVATTARSLTSRYGVEVLTGPLDP